MIGTSTMWLHELIWKRQFLWRRRRGNPANRRGHPPPPPHTLESGSVGVLDTRSGVTACCLTSYCVDCWLSTFCVPRSVQSDPLIPIERVTTHLPWMSTLTTQKYFCVNHEDQRCFFQFQIIIIYVLVGSFEYLCYRSTAIINISFFQCVDRIWRP